MTNKEKELSNINAEGFTNIISFNKGFQEGKAQTLKDVKEKIKDLDISDEMINIMWNDDENYPIPTKKQINDIIKNKLLGELK